MMKNEFNGKRDHVQGNIAFGKKWNPETKKYEQGKFFNIYLWEVDKNGEPVVIGQRKVGNKTFDQHHIMKVFRIAESSLLKVANGESKSCNIYYSERR